MVSWCQYLGSCAISAYVFLYFLKRHEKLALKICSPFVGGPIKLGQKLRICVLSLLKELPDDMFFCIIVWSYTFFCIIKHLFCLIIHMFDCLISPNRDTKIQWNTFFQGDLETISHAFFKVISALYGPCGFLRWNCCGFHNC